MSENKNIFISHVHKDDERLTELKNLISKSGMEVRDGSINSDKPNAASNEDYIKSKIIAPRIRWASTLVVLITPNTAKSDWVNWEIEHAHRKEKRIVGVFALGATDADIPEALQKYSDAAVVGWRGQRVVDAINGKIEGSDDPATGEPRTKPLHKMKRYAC